MSIQKKPDKRDLRYIKFITDRMNCEREDEIAAKAGFDSPIDLYRQLAQDGFPVCAMCGATHVEEGHCEQTEKKRRGTAEGEPIELPPAKEAAPLFKEALDKLLEAVEFLQGDYESASSSRKNKEYLQGRLFFQYTREEIHWADDLGRTRYTAAVRSPGNWLTELIAVYLLVYGDPEPLIEKLHPPSRSLDREQLRKHIEGVKKRNESKPGLLGSAEDVAILIRGGDLPRGRRAGELNADEQIIRRRIIQGRQEGYSDQQIIEMLAEDGISTSKAEINQLRGPNPPDPSS